VFQCRIKSVYLYVLFLCYSLINVIYYYVYNHTCVWYHDSKWVEDISYGFLSRCIYIKNIFLIVIQFEKTILLLFSDQRRSIVLGWSASWLDATGKTLMSILQSIMIELLYSARVFKVLFIYLRVVCQNQIMSLRKNENSHHKMYIFTYIF